MHSLEIKPQKKIRLLYQSKKHNFYVWKFDRNVYLDHPENGGDHFYIFSASLDNENEMKKFKAIMNLKINQHNAEGLDYRKMGA